MTAPATITPPALPPGFSQMEFPNQLEAMRVTAGSARACVELMGHISNELERQTAEAFAILLLEQAKQMCGLAERKAVSIDYTTTGGVPVSLHLQLTAAEVEFITDREALQSAVASDAACRQVPCLWKRRLDALTEACESHLTDFDPAKFLQALKAAVAPIT